MNIQEIRAKYPQYDDLPDDQLLKGLHGKFYADMPYSEFAAKVGAGDTAKKDEGGIMQSIAQGAGNLAAGATRGAVSIGSTILAPFQAAFQGTGQSGAQTQRGKIIGDVESGLRGMGADTDSPIYAAGKIGSEIAGTAGVGGILGKGAQALGAAPKVINALSSGGFSLGSPVASTFAGRAGDLALRSAASAATGGAAAGMVDPESAGTGAMIAGAIPGGIKAAGMIGSGAKNLAGSAIQQTLGLMTGTGANAVKTAFESGKRGASSFLDNMRGKVDMTGILDDAKAALSKMRMDRGAEYRNGMAQVSGDKTVIDFAPIDRVVSGIASMGAYKGQQINKNAAGVVNDIVETVNNWKSLNPAEYHTPEGLDALKQAIGDIRDTTQFGTAARRAADSAYNAVKNQITMQAPTYAKTMKAYSEASDLITEIQKALVGGEKTSADTAMRKLQSLMRNNVNTNYGNRLNLARELETKGGADIMPAIAGQAMSSATPRGLQGVAATGAGLYGMANPLTLAALPFTSPRLMGEAAYGLGRVAGGVNSMQQSLIRPQLGGMPQGLLSDPWSYQSLLATIPALAGRR